MNISKEVTLRVAQKLFDQQNFSSEFLIALQEFINSRYATIYCCVMYAQSHKFMEFMAQYPELDCKERQVILSESGRLRYRESYKQSAYCLF